MACKSRAGEHHQTALIVDGVSLSIRVRPQVVNVAVGDAEVYTFEPSVRLHAAFDRGRHYRRSLDHRFLETWRVKPRGFDGLRQRWVAGDEADGLAGHIHRRVANLGAWFVRWSARLGQ